MAWKKNSRCKKVSDVGLYVSPWVSVMRNASYRGPISVRICGSEIEEVMISAMNEAKFQAFYMDCNAVVAYECSLYLWEDPIVCEATGTLSVLEPLY